MSISTTSKPDRSRRRASDSGDDPGPENRRRTRRGRTVPSGEQHTSQTQGAAGTSAESSRSRPGGGEPAVTRRRARQLGRKTSAVPRSNSTSAHLERWLSGTTRRPSASTSHSLPSVPVRGAPPSVVRRGRSGSSFLNATPMGSVFHGQKGRPAVVRNHPFSISRTSSRWTLTNPPGSEVRCGCSTVCVGAAVLNRTPPSR